MLSANPDVFLVTELVNENKVGHFQCTTGVTKQLGCFDLPYAGVDYLLFWDGDHLIMFLPSLDQEEKWLSLDFSKQ